MSRKTFFGIKSAGLKAIFAATTLAVLSTSSWADTFERTVDASVNSTGNGGSFLDTGLTFEAGDSFSVNTSGSWTGDKAGDGFCFEVSANGSACFGGTIPMYSLVGRFDDGQVFLIGSQYSGVATNGGNLYLGFYDVDSANNFGSVTATITTPVPEPSTYAMMLAGLAVLVVRRRRQSQG